MPRSDGRAAADLRPITFQRNFTRNAPGSVLACFGNTRVLCTAMAQDSVPPFLQGKGKGWLTAEYSMLPSSTETRKPPHRSRPAHAPSAAVAHPGRHAPAGV